MGIERTNCADDRRLAAYHAVRDGDLLRSHGLFVAEGRHVVRRVVEDRRYRVESVLVNDAALRDLEPAMATLDPAVPIFVCAAERLAEVAGYHVHRGCLALVHRPPPASVDAVTLASKTIVVLEGVSNADNVGGVFRNAAAFGVDGVVLSPACCDPLYRKAIRTSMAAVLRVPFARAAADDWPGALIRVKAAGFTIVALTPRAPSETLHEFASRLRPARLAVMAGSEGGGLTPEAEAAADYRVRIPIAGGIDSLNLVVATGIALYRCVVPERLPAGSG